MDLLDLLDLTPAEEAPSALIDEDAVRPPDRMLEPDEVFYGRSHPTALGRVFGGQVLAQAIVASGRSVERLEGPPRRLHSMHGYFLRAGAAKDPILFLVERLRDGTSFSARQVHAVQFGLPILSMILSFQTQDSGLEHQGRMPQVCDPDTLPSLAESLAGIPGTFHQDWTLRRAVDIRHCEGHLYAAPASTQHWQNLWMRPFGPLPDDPLIHAAMLAYESDYTVLESILRVHNLNWTDRRLHAASLDHAMWFHGPVRADDWVLYSQFSPWSGNARGLAMGRIFSRDGRLLASVGQEGMMRLRRARTT